LRAHLPEVVRAHTVSDVPVGAFLSGGMDSSIVVALMARECGSDFATFAVGVAEEDFDELPYARLVAAHYGTKSTSGKTVRRRAGASWKLTCEWY
jgi:asparagine synthase (glutamine-hydrolysing)